MRNHDLELGRDADTGGQILYVIELAKALAKHPRVGRVDVLTRRVIDSKVSSDYAQTEESLGDGVNLFRLNCGPRRYLRKEVLWPHLHGFIDQAIHHIRSVGHVPDVIHSHYADAGLVGSRLAGLLGVPLMHTGHSLGRDKLSRLLAKGLKPASIEDQYHINSRIEAEEIVLGTAAKVIASTQQEVDEQYATYDNYHPKRMVVIPPGVDLSRFHAPDGSELRTNIARQLNRFLDHPTKPIILAISRADERKNIAALVKAYGKSPELQTLANLVIVAGNRDDIQTMDKGSRSVLTDLLMLIDRYDLYGKIAYPKHHAPDDIPILYRLVAKRKGVFVNPALTEPFGLTLIEAAASGVPIVATNDGGPKEIISKCHNGVLIDPFDEEDIKSKLVTLFSNNRTRARFSRNGLAGAVRHFSWTGHVETYVSQLESILSKTKTKRHVRPVKSRLTTVDRWAFSAIDNALFGDETSMRALLDVLQRQAKHSGFGIATGRSLNSTTRLLKKLDIPMPDILVTSTGTEIHYYHQGRGFVADHFWPQHIDYRWESKALLKTMGRIPGLKLCPKSEQNRHKISYTINPDLSPTPREIKRILRTRDLHAKLVVTDEKYLDLLPIRASKGLAIRYLAMKWGLPLERILVVGDSGNDEEMLLGNTLAVVVGNHSTELDKLKHKSGIFFAEGKYAQGIIEGLNHYQFLGDIIVPEETLDESKEFDWGFGLTA